MARNQIRSKEAGYRRARAASPCSRTEGRGEGTPSVAVRVEQPDLEARRPEANHDVLKRIAEATGGQVVELDQLEKVFGTIRDRNVQIPDDVTESLWDSKLILMLFVLMISLEWILRKAFGLL